MDGKKPILRDRLFAVHRPQIRPQIRPRPLCHFVRLSHVIPRREERPTRDPLASDGERGDSSIGCASFRNDIDLRIFLALPVKIPQKCCAFLREPYSGGCRAQRGGRVVTVGTARAEQSLSHFVTAPFAQGSLFIPSSRTRNVVKWRDLLASDREPGDSSIGCASFRNDIDLRTPAPKSSPPTHIPCPPCVREGAERSEAGGL